MVDNLEALDSQPETKVQNGEMKDDEEECNFIQLNMDNLFCLFRKIYVLSVSRPSITCVNVIVAYFALPQFGWKFKSAMVLVSYNVPFYSGKY